MAVAHLCYAALQHASEGITHTDRKIKEAFDVISKMDATSVSKKAENVRKDVWQWAQENPIKAGLMLIGLGIGLFKAKALKQLMYRQASGYMRWSRAAGSLKRFIGFVFLMIARLVVSTLVPPTSPGFSIIVQAATPESEKWTAMPFFLLSSTVAGAVPYVMDKLGQCVSGKDFQFTMLMRRLTLIWPLTCWTGPAMMEVFRTAGGGKLGASLAVIVAHAAPFMGAQTTLMQRYFLPHPLDTIISQPFGMSEDLVSMALAEATSDPHLASLSLTVLVCFFNLAQFALFERCTDLKALVTAFLNLGVWALFAFSGLVGLTAVALQLITQVLVVPFSMRAVWSVCGDPDGRGDADLFESYYDILYNLYDLIPIGGYFVCDDCPNVFAAQMAVSQFRSRHGIKEPQAEISGSASGTFWKKERDVRVDYEKYRRWNATRNSKSKLS